MKQFPVIYKRDSKGNIREWRMEVDGNQYRTIAGLQDGQQITSEWTTVDGKNTGRANETSPEEQAISEVESHYKKKLDVDYHKDIKNIDKPKIFKPMLAQKWEDRKDSIDFSDRAVSVYVQPKLDGIRCIISEKGAFSRTGKPITAIPHIVDALAPIFEKHPDMIFDGELYNHDLKHDFNSIVSMVRKTKPSPVDLTLSEEKVQYHIYDCPSVPKEFIHRIFEVYHLMKEFGIWAEDHTNEWPTAIRIVKTRNATSEEEVDEWYATYLTEGYEGGIIRINGAYEQKRSKNLLKRKDFDDAEFEIVAIEEGNGNWAGCAKAIVFKNPDGSHNKATIQGSQDYGRHVLKNAASYIGKQATVQYFNLTPDGAPRFPIAKILHEDKRW